MSYLLTALHNTIVGFVHPIVASNLVEVEIDGELRKVVRRIDVEGTAG